MTTKKKQLKAQSWNEEVTFVDCPACSETIELGSGVIFGDSLEEDCPKCKVTFHVVPP
jgi:hypothetical protein